MVKGAVKSHGRCAGLNSELGTWNLELGTRNTEFKNTATPFIELLDVADAPGIKDRRFFNRRAR